MKKTVAYTLTPNLWPGPSKPEIWWYEKNKTRAIYSVYVQPSIPIPRVCQYMYKPWNKVMYRVIIHDPTRYCTNCYLQCDGASWQILVYCVPFPSQSRAPRTFIFRQYLSSYWIGIYCTNFGCLRELSRLGIRVPVLRAAFCSEQVLLLAVSFETEYIPGGRLQKGGDVILSCSLAPLEAEDQDDGVSCIRHRFWNQQLGISRDERIFQACGTVPHMPIGSWRSWSERPWKWRGICMDISISTVSCLAFSRPR